MAIPVLASSGGSWAEGKLSVDGSAESLGEVDVLVP
jgi:hypothetical protein